jgi:hypothetical protein
MKYSQEKVTKYSLRTFKKYNPFIWENKYLLTKKPGDLISCCDGFNHRIKEVFFTELPYKSKSRIELYFDFEDGHDFSIYCSSPRILTVSQVKQNQIINCINLMNHFKEGDTLFDKQKYKETEEKYNQLLSGIEFWDEFGCKTDNSQMIKGI